MDKFFGNLHAVLGAGLVLAIVLMLFVLADGTMHAHCSEMPVGTYKKGHRHGAANLAAFGSVARDQAGPDSDVDLLVDLPPRTGLLQRMLPQEDLGLGYGIYFLLFYSGFFLFPFVAGWILDETGDPAAPLWFAAGLMMISAALILIFYRGAHSMKWAMRHSN